MKPIKYLLILIMLVSLNSCMVRDTKYTSSHHQHSLNSDNWAFNSYSLSHPRPPIN